MSAQVRKTKADPMLGNEHIKVARPNLASKKHQDENASTAINYEIFGQFAEMMSDKRYLESGHGASRLMELMTHEIMECYSRHMAKLNEFASDAMRCHSVMELMTLNAKTMEYFYKDYTHELLKLSTTLFGDKGMAQLYGVKRAHEEVSRALGA